MSKISRSETYKKGTLDELTKQVQAVNVNPYTLPVYQEVLSDPVGDRRRFYPNANLLRPAHAIKPTANRLVIGRGMETPVRFALPNYVAICVRRKLRREVLHALKLTGKSGRGGGKRRRSAYSGIRC